MTYSKWKSSSSGTELFGRDTPYTLAREKVMGNLLPHYASQESYIVASVIHSLPSYTAAKSKTLKTRFGFDVLFCHFYFTKLLLARV